MLDKIFAEGNFLRKTFGGLEKSRTFATALREMLLSKGQQAEIAQLVEHNLAKVGVASSSLVFRSICAQVAEW